MIKDYKFSLVYKSEGRLLKAEGMENELYSVTADVKNNGLELKIFPKKPIEMVNAYIDFGFNYTEGDKIFVNGYQSWTTSREYELTDIQKGLMGFAKYPPTKNFCRIFGDYDFQQYSKKGGVFHSYSYTYVKRAGQIILFGSLKESNGFTVFHFDCSAGRISVQKDVEGVTIDKEYTLHSIYFTQGGYNEVFDEYFSNLRIPKPKYNRMTGYTSWYNYYGGITEEILSRDIDGLAVLGDKADIFQIDDGYQTAVGDWLTVKTKKYPHGMKYLVDKIHSNGYKAGLWLAPFNAQKSSVIAKKHPEWLIKSPSGKPEIGSIAWGGAYTLDFYIPDAADYIRNVFRSVFDDWGFDMVKLDFLYSICHTPRHNKSRGQIMTEAMEFLRDCVGDKILLGCGVPLFPSFGLVDFCRISSDVGKSFKDPFFVKHSNQEVLSTKSAMNNSIFRRHLDGRAFVNDPDVFYLRENNLKGKDKLFLNSGKLRFTDEQRRLLAKVNSMCGNVLFVSDNVGGYDAAQRRLVEEVFRPSDKIVTDAEYVSKNVIAIDYLEGTEAYRLEFNTVTGQNNTVKL